MKRILIALLLLSSSRADFILRDAIRTGGQPGQVIIKANTGAGGVQTQVVSTTASGGASSGLTDTELRASPVPVSGTISVGNTITVNTHAVTQSGTWHVGNITGTISLPTGASSSAAQTDGSQQTQVVNSATGAQVLSTAPGSDTGQRSLAVRVISSLASGGAGGTQYDEDTATTAADKLTMAGVVRKDTAATLVDTDGDRTQLQVDAVGRLHVNGSGVTQPVSIAGNQAINTVQLGGTAISMNTGTRDAGTQRVTIASNDVVPASQSGSWTVSSSQSGTWTMQPGNTANTTPWLVDVNRINGITPLMGNGVTGTGSQRVTIASDNTAFGVNAAQSGAWNITNVSGTVSLPTGAATENSLSRISVSQGSALGSNFQVMTGGSVATTAPTYTSGNINPVSLDTKGNLRVIQPQPATYMATGTWTPAVTISRDIWNIHGSATTTVYVTRIVVTGTATATSLAHIALVKRSTATTVGTFSTLTNVPADANNAAAGASVKTYTVVPTEGTLIGPLWHRRFLLPIPTLTATQFPQPQEAVFDFTEPGKQPIILRGVAQQIALQPATALPAGTSLTIMVEWYEL